MELPSMLRQFTFVRCEHHVFYEQKHAHKDLFVLAIIK